MSLLNQLEDGQHCIDEILSFDGDILEIIRSCISKGERADRGFGQSKFISHQDLNYHTRQQELPAST